MMNSYPILIKLKKNIKEERYGFSISTMEGNIHYVRDVQKGNLAEKNGLEEGDCILSVNNVNVHMLLDNKELLKLVNQNPNRFDVIVLKGSRHLTAEPNLRHNLEKQLESLKIQVFVNNEYDNWIKILMLNNRKIEEEKNRLKEENSKLQKQVYELETSQTEFHMLKLAISRILEDYVLENTDSTEKSADSNGINPLIDKLLLLINSRKEETFKPAETEQTERPDKSELTQEINKLKTIREKLDQIMLSVKKDQIEKLRNALQCTENGRTLPHLKTTSQPTSV